MTLVKYDILYFSLCVNRNKEEKEYSLCPNVKYYMKKKNICMFFSKWVFLSYSHYLCTGLNYQKVLSFIYQLSLKPKVLCVHRDIGLNKSHTNTTLLNWDFLKTKL